MSKQAIDKLKNILGTELMDVVWGPDLEIKPKSAIITGINGQDGSYLAELLLEKGYAVYGLVRRSSTESHLEKIEHLLDKVELIEGDLTDQSCLLSLLRKLKPDELYNLAAQSHVKTSFEQPAYTWDVNAKGVLHLLEAIRLESPHTKMLQASTSEMFGRSYSMECEYDMYTVLEHFNLDDVKPHTVQNSLDGKHFAFQNEETPFQPQSPYSVAKAAAHYYMQLYRRSYGLKTYCSICFNHESPRRGERFVTRKITKWIGEFVKWHKEHPTIFENAQIGAYENMDSDYIYQGLAGSPRFPKLRLGNLDAKRDWGHAKDYMGAMWTIMQTDKPDDFVVSTQETYSIRDFLAEAFGQIGITEYMNYVVIDPAFYRPAEVDYLLGDSTKLRELTGWSPQVSFHQLVKEMVEHDIANA